MGQINAKGEYYVRYFGTHAHPDIIPNDVKTNTSSLFDTASITKAVLTLLVLWAVTRKLVSLDTDMTTFIPGLKVVGKVRPTVLHFLTYGAKTHLEHVLKSPYAEFCSESLRVKLFTSKVEVCDFRYGNHTPIMLGMMLQQITEKPLDTLAEEVLFKPLGMMNTTFRPQVGDISKVVATENGLCGIVHDEITRKLGFPSGAAGVFASCEDLLRLMRLTLTEGSVEGHQIVDPELISQLGINQMSGDIMFGLGFGLWDQFRKGYDVMEESMSEGYSDGAFFKGGFTGTQVSVFPKLGVANVILTNHVHPVRPTDSNDWINRFRYCANMSMLCGECPADAVSL